MGEEHKNVAYTQAYLDYLADIDRFLFRPDCFCGQETTQLAELTIVTRHYQCCDHPRYPFNLSGFDNEVRQNGSVIYRYRSHDDSGFQWLIHHQNGRRYLIFKQGLYGYSVLDLASRQDHRYYPKGSFPTGETFIWCEVHYNPQNNLAAVDGCFWACPSSVLLVDLAEPMRDAVFFDVGDYYEEEYDDLRFFAWNGTDLVMERSPGKSEETIVIPQSHYRRWMKEAADRQ